MSWEQQKLPEHLKHFHFTVIGGFAHGWRIPFSNGLRCIQFAQEGGRRLRGYEHVSHIFKVHETGGLLVVFAPANLASGSVADFLHGKVNEEDIKAFSVSESIAEPISTKPDL